MKKAILAIVLGVAMSLMSATAVLAEDVVVTPNGKKYHHVDSRFAKVKGAEVLSLEEAKELGFEPSKNYLKRVAEKATKAKK